MIMSLMWNCNSEPGSEMNQDKYGNKKWQNAPEM